jgi:hypothetical protein
VLKFAAFSLAWLIALTGISFAAYKLGLTDFAFTKLFEYQVEKTKNSSQFETVFVGDSSLGNGVDAKIWEQLSGEKTGNLALTGAYGYAGTLNMLRRVIKKGYPEKVIIMQTGDMLTRDVAWDGWLHTALTTSDFLDVPTQELLKTFANFDGLTSAARALVRRFGAPNNSPIAHDYIAQGASMSLGNREHFKVSVESFNPEKIKFLNALGGFCQENSLDCWYGVGPWYEKYCQQSSEWLELVIAKALEAGLKTLPSPYCFSDEEIGDAWDHVAGPFKPQSTKYYFDLLNDVQVDGRKKGLGQ